MIPDELRAENERLREALRRIADVQPLPTEFRWTGTGTGLEDLFDAELRHKSGVKPVDHLKAWLPMFRPFAFATRDDSWGELEKLICTTLRNYTRSLAAAEQARAVLEPRS